MKVAYEGTPTVAEASKGAGNRAARPRAVARGLYETLFFRALANNTDGLLEIIHPDGRVNWLGGEREGVSSARLEVKDPAFFESVVLYDEIGFGEAYVRGLWDSPEPIETLAWFMRNSRTTPSFSHSVARGLVTGPLTFWNKFKYFLRANTRTMSRKNISEHYDLSNEFFQLWLDETMAYSAGVYPDERSSLHDSQLMKFRMIAEKLQLGPGVHLLEIGSGWGGFACYAARTYGCRVTSVTISREQLAWARERAVREGVDKLVEFRFQDYRDLEGQFDRIVSIEMVEALGWEYLDAFFGKCAQVLKRDGIMCIQAITFPDPHYRRYLHSMDFTKKHIFPGSLLLSLRETLQSLDRTGDLQAVHVESIGLHYARTLRDWRLNFEARLDEVRALGFDETFIRKWRYYLLFCEVGFAHRYINDVQIVFSRPQNMELGNYIGALQ